MSDLIPITPAEERRLLQAVNGAVSRANQGETPNEALAKAAAAEGLNTDFTRRAVQIFNTSKTIHHIQNNREDGVKRASSFALADADEVLRLMIGDVSPATHMPKAAASVREGDIADFATIRAADIPRMVKAAAEAYPGDVDEKYRKVSRFLNAQRMKVASLRTELAALTEKQHSAFQTLIDSFRDPYSMPFSEFRKQAVARRGEAVGVVIDALEGRTKSFGKRASFDASRKAFDLFDRAMDVSTKAAAAKAEWEAAANELEAMAREVKEAGRAKEPASGPFDFYKPAAAADPETVAGSGVVPTPFGQWMDTYLKPLGTPDLTPTDTGFGDRLRAIDAKAQLARIMGTDEVLGRGRYAPDDLYTAYNDLVTLSPALANQPIVLRAQLRRYLEGLQSQKTGPGYDTLEAKNLASTMKDVESQQMRYSSPGQEA